MRQPASVCGANARRAGASNARRQPSMSKGHAFWGAHSLLKAPQPSLELQPVFRSNVHEVPQVSPRRSSASEKQQQQQQADHRGIATQLSIAHPAPLRGSRRRSARQRPSGSNVEAGGRRRRRQGVGHGRQGARGDRLCELLLHVRLPVPPGARGLPCWITGCACPVLAVEAPCAAGGRALRKEEMPSCGAFFCFAAFSACGLRQALREHRFFGVGLATCP